MSTHDRHGALSLDQLNWTKPIIQSKCLPPIDVKEEFKINNFADSILHLFTLI